MINNLDGVPVLVTGANGFIGSHLVRKLLALGAKVSVFVEPDTSLWRIDDYKSQIKIYNVNIVNFDKVATAIQKIQPVKIYHLAANSDVRRSLELIDTMIENNLKGTTNLLRSLIDNQCKIDCFINTGTCEEYGDGNVPFSETQREKPVSPYSSSKLAANNFCQMLYEIKRVPIVILRPFLTYGPGQVNEMFIPSLIRKCILNEGFEMTKGEQTREFNFVSDIVEGYIKASINDKAIGEIINLSNGREYKIKDVADLIVKLTKTKIKLQIGKLSYRLGETMHFYGSNEKAKRILGWQPKISLDEGLKKTIQWYKGYLNNQAKA